MVFGEEGTSKWGLKSKDHERGEVRDKGWETGRGEKLQDEASVGWESMVNLA